MSADAALLNAKDAPHFGEWLRRRRTERGIAQKAMAAAFSVSQQAWSNYESGTRALPSEIALGVADMLEISYADMLLALGGRLPGAEARRDQIVANLPEAGSLREWAIAELAVLPESDLSAVVAVLRGLRLAREGYAPSAPPLPAERVPASPNPAPPRPSR